MRRYDELLAYWFAETDAASFTHAAFSERPPIWFARNETVDAHVRAHFIDDIERARRGEYDEWRHSARGRLALVVLLDQFPRNAYRDSGAAFTSDAKALDLVREGLMLGVEREYNESHRLVFFLPLMHSEDLEIQASSLERFRSLRDTSPDELRPILNGAVEAAERHAWIIERFGRYPHRNRALARETTPEEAAFLGQPNSSF